MSAILSADDLNDFISPGVACIKPIETLPAADLQQASNPYEVTTEDKVAASQPPPPAQISLTDCLACSGCVTSAEAVLVTLQSHTEVLTTLDTYRSLQIPWHTQRGIGHAARNGTAPPDAESKLFVASVSPQARASLAAVFSVTEMEAAHMIAQLLSGPSGMRTGGHHRSDFTWVIDTNVLRDVCLEAAAHEVATALSPEDQTPSAVTSDEGSADGTPRKPILTSACPGWICYAEKTHPYILPHLSRLKSPQALTGTLVKSVLSQRYNIPPSQVWHLAIMPCFDKKLEAARGELTSSAWLPGQDSSGTSADAVRDVDCVITARELLQLASARGIPFSSLPRTPLSRSVRMPFPDPTIDAFLFPLIRRKRRHEAQTPAAGSSGGYLHHILSHHQSLHPGSTVTTTRGRNADVVEYTLSRGTETIFRAARYYGFRNITNLTRTLKPSKLSRMPGAKVGGSRRPGGAAGAGGQNLKDYAYVEVMACPGGCTNGGGQIKVGEVANVRAAQGVIGAVGTNEEVGPSLEDSNIAASTVATTAPSVQQQKDWLARVDEAYFSASSPSSEDDSDCGNESESNNNVVSVPAKDVDMDVDMHLHTDADGDTAMHHLSSSSSAPPTETSTSPSTPLSTSPSIASFLARWSSLTHIDTRTLLYTSFRRVESDVGAGSAGGGAGGAGKKQGRSDVERVAALSSAAGGGW